MKIAVIGTGYVGLSTGACLAEMGHHVVCIDTDKRKVEGLEKGISPIYEPGLENLLMKNRDRLSFVNSHQHGVEHADVVILAVGTPQAENGAADLGYLYQAVRDVEPFLQEKAVVVIKSTVPVGTNQKVTDLLGNRFAVVSNPEFLRQGSAIMDTLHPDRIVIGARQGWEKAAETVKEMYATLGAVLVRTDPESAELIKYASNAFLATKISFINQMALLCEAVGGDVEDVSIGMGLDDRIGRAFLQAGIGYGGSCFPKDVSALYHVASEAGVEFGMLAETRKVNEKQKSLLVRKALARFGSLSGLSIGVLGLAFKPETDDMREAPSIVLVRELVKAGAHVVAYDPVAIDHAKEILEVGSGEGGTLRFGESLASVVSGADAVMIVTEWSEFVEADWVKLIATMKTPIVFDGRNALDETKLKGCAEIEYYPIGKLPIKKS